MDKFLIEIDKKASVNVEPVKAQPSWSSAIELIQSPIPREVNCDRLTEEKLQMAEYMLSVIAHWIYKKRWNNRHRMPYSKRVCENYEIFADILLAYCSLCIELHAVGMGSQYPNALAWFSGVFEGMKLDLLDSYEDERTKNGEVQAVRKLVRSLRNGKNPFNLERDIHLHRVIAATQSIVAAKTADTVFTPLWTGSVQHGKYRIKGLIQALTSYATYLDKGDCEVIKVKQSALVTIQPGRNRPKPLYDFSL